MRRGFKPYNKRKIFKRKNGGQRFLLGQGHAKFDFPANQMLRDPSEGLMNLIQLILGQKKQSYVRTSDR